MKRVIQCILFILSIRSYSQQDSTQSSLKFTGYIEVYYGYDIRKPADHNRPPFIYSFNRSNEVNLNIGFIKASYDNKSVRANLALMTGTYSNANLASEPGVLKNIYEANAGIKIHKHKNVWIDAGVFGAHLGIESAVGKDAWNLTRSMAAENSPYYESGIKGTYLSDNSKWLISGLFLNGWQCIQRPEGNNSLAVGHQITFTPSSKFTLNSSSFIGNTKPDSAKQMRYFHNLYAKYEWRDTYGFIAGFDIGAEQKTKNSSDYNIWYTPYIQLRYKLSSNIVFAARGEYYYDKNEVIITTGTNNGFQTIGYSINADIKIHPQAVWRIEARSLNSKDNIFILDGKSSNQNYCLTTSLAIAL
jgi:hypothetical protein